MFLRRIIPLIVLLLAGCGGEPEDPAAKLRATIAAAEQAVEARSLKQAASYISPDYSDPHGNDRRSIARLLLGYLHRHSSIHLLIRIDELQLDPDGRHADVRLYAAMTGVPVESMEALVSVKADLYRFDMRFVAGDDGWQVVHADWRRARLDDLLD
jgi:hypothetical protein